MKAGQAIQTQAGIPIPAKGMLRDLRITSMNSSQKVAQLMESKVDLSKMKSPGSHLNHHEKLCRDLARAYQEQEQPGSSWCISWPNQVKAQDYFNQHGFVDTLKHLTELQGVLSHYKELEMKQVMQDVHNALEARWKTAGSPVHGTEPCLWDMERAIDGLEQHRTPEDVLAEATELLETWIDCGSPASAVETAAINKAKEHLAVAA